MKVPDRIIYSALAYPVCNFTVLNEVDRLIIPEYQRDFVWSDEQKELLIDSIFRSIPIGNIFLNERRGSPTYEVVDGQQRLTTIFKFLNDEFTYQGVLHSELPEEHQRRIDQYVIQTYITKYSKVSDIIRLYYRLNWAGTEHTVDEMLEIEKRSKEESQ